MHFILSPAKKLATHQLPSLSDTTQAYFLNESACLASILKKYSPQELAQLMKISDKLALLNMERYTKMEFSPLREEYLFPAISLFNGDAYEGLNIVSMQEKEIDYIKQHLLILSGLYGLLKPLDEIYPYRLEMGTELVSPEGKNLYQFWGKKITQYLNHCLSTNMPNVLINLASKEYFSAIQAEDIHCPIITPVFKDYKNGQYKIISFFAKRARGLMVRFAAQNQLLEAEGLKDFDLEGYQYSIDHSTQTEWVFLRNEMKT